MLIVLIAWNSIRFPTFCSPNWPQVKNCTAVFH